MPVQVGCPRQRISRGRRRDSATWALRRFAHPLKASRKRSYSTLAVCSSAAAIPIPYCIRYNVSSLPIMEKGEQFLRVIGIFILYVATIKLVYNEKYP